MSKYEGIIGGTIDTLLIDTGSNLKSGSTRLASNAYGGGDELRYKTTHNM
jgi:hypothetical protein